MGKKNKAKQKAKQLLREAGSKLSAKEAQKIARKADIPIQKVVQIAQRNDNIGIKVPTRTENRVQAIVEKRSQPDPPPENQNTGPTIEQVIAERDTAITERDTAIGERDTVLSDLDAVQGELSSIGSTYQAMFDDMSNKYNEALSGKLAIESQLSGARAEAEAEKQRAAELEKKRDDERELSINQQLGGLRSGSVASGGGYTGLGSLSSGRSSYSIATGGKSGGVLDRAYQDIDPTDSVLNKKVAVDAASGLSGSGGRRARARRRALASGGASSYYATRFG